MSGCLYDIDGDFCGQPVRARGYCMRHYKILNRKGAFSDTRVIPAGSDSETADRNMGHVARARLQLEQHTEAIVGHLMRAIEVAANKGDSRPAEWGLLHARAVEPVLTGGGASTGKGDSQPAGVRVLIGVQLSQQQPGHAVKAMVQAPTIPQNAGPNFQPAQSLPVLEGVDLTALAQV